MPSLPASQPAEDGEAVGTPVPAAYDPSSEEPPVTHGGARKSVAPPPTGAEANGAIGASAGDGPRKGVLLAIYMAGRESVDVPAACWNT